MTNIVHKVQPTNYQHPLNLPMCNPDNSRDHNFIHMGMCGLPIDGNNTHLAVVNRYYCSKCLLLVDVEDHRTEKSNMEAMRLGSLPTPTGVQ